VLVLLIGEIDLSVGAVSGFTAGVMAVLSVKTGLPAILSIGLGVLSGILIGLLQGFWFAKLHVPSFVVTLAGYLGWQGALLYVLGSTGTINLTSPFIVGIANARLPVALGWVFGLVFLIAITANWLRERSERLRSGLEVQPIAVLAVRITVVAAATFGAIGLMSVNRNPVAGGEPIRGVPSAVLFFIGFVVLFDWITRRTRFGRYMFAVGGNVEAARRAGVNVDRIRIAVFILCL
jgi:D-xylose transport system permease protein